MNEFYRVPEAPHANPPSRAFRDTLQVVLTAADRDGAIHYTLDGSAATAQSPKYTGSLLLDTTTTLKAITVVPGIRPSDLLKEFYPLVSDSLSEPP